MRTISPEFFLEQLALQPFGMSRSVRNHLFRVGAVGGVSELGTGRDMAEMEVIISEILELKSDIDTGSSMDCGMNNDRGGRDLMERKARIRMIAGREMSRWPS